MKRIFKSNDINKVYLELIMELLQNGERVNDTLELRNVCVELSSNANPYLSFNIRSVPMKYLLAENIFYAAGSNDLEYIGQFAGLWNLISDDNKTVNSAYGYIMQNKFGFNQIEKVIEILQKDEGSRRAIININEPNENIFETKDEQCTIYLQFFIRNNKLHMTTVMRSNDIYFGLTFDIPAFMGLQKYIAHRLKVKVGKYTHFVSSFHMYLRDQIICEKILTSKILPVPYEIDFIKLYNYGRVFLQNTSVNNIIDFCVKHKILKEKDNEDKNFELWLQNLTEKNKRF